MRTQGKRAFFLRLEHISSDLEIAFEEGTYQEFQDWVASNEEGWLLLDSIDEARLTHPNDFEKAIRKLALKISLALPRAHILITSRITAWRWRTDLANCNERFPLFIEKEESVYESDDESVIDKKSAQESKKSMTKKELIGFKIYSLIDLSEEQVSRFARAKGIKDHSKFLAEIKRQDAWMFTARPQDLEEIIDFWNTKGKIGARLELMQNSIERRLSERDQNRVDMKSLALKKLQKGARLLAAFCTLTHEYKINVLDGAHNSGGLDVYPILSSWDGKDCQILLNCPIFDEAIYGSVRFHHRFVREYLTARWFDELLKNGGSRQKIENLFFREQYGIEVIVPSMKPILSWLVLFDDKIMDKVYRLEPEIILEGGDPGELLLEKRKEILRSICEKIAEGAASQSIYDRVSVQRFVSADMADDIKELIQKYHDNNEVLSYLLLMIWQGHIKTALPEAKSYARSAIVPTHMRITAIRAVKEIGTTEDFNDLLKSFLAEKEGRHDRRILAELIDNVDLHEKLLAGYWKL